MSIPFEQDSHKLFLLLFISRRDINRFAESSGPSRKEWGEYLGEDPYSVINSLLERELLTNISSGKVQISDNGKKLLDAYLKDVSKKDSNHIINDIPIPEHRLRRLLSNAMIAASAGIIGNRADAVLISIVTSLKDIVVRLESLTLQGVSLKGIPLKGLQTMIGMPTNQIPSATQSIADPLSFIVLPLVILFAKIALLIRKRR
jgi:hypothetical protein